MPMRNRSVVMQRARVIVIGVVVLSSVLQRAIAGVPRAPADSSEVDVICSGTLKEARWGDETTYNNVTGHWVVCTLRVGVVFNGSLNGTEVKAAMFSGAPEAWTYSVPPVRNRRLLAFLIRATPADIAPYRFVQTEKGSVEKIPYMYVGSGMPDPPSTPSGMGELIGQGCADKNEECQLSAIHLLRTEFAWGLIDVKGRAPILERVRAACDTGSGQVKVYAWIVRIIRGDSKDVEMFCKLTKSGRISEGLEDEISREVFSNRRDVKRLLIAVLRGNTITLQHALDGFYALVTEDNWQPAENERADVLQQLAVLT